MRSSTTATALICSLTTIMLTADAIAEPFTYQGSLQHGAAAFNGSADLWFRLHDHHAANSPVSAPVVHCGTLVVDGLFVVDLDFGNVFHQENLWLEVRVHAPSGGGSCDGSPNPAGYDVLTPRQPITSAPRACYAASSSWAGLQNIPAGFADGIDNVGGITLPYTEAYAGSDTTAIQITQIGTGGAAQFSIDNPANYWEALNVTSNGSGPALNVLSSGGGSAAQYQILSNTNVFPVISASTQGSGACLNANGGLLGYGVNATVSGVGNAVQATSSGSGNAVQGKVSAGGTGNAGLFEIQNPFNAQPALFASTTGTGVAARFELGHTTSAGAGVFAVAGSTNGNSAAIKAIGNSASDGLYASTSGAGTAVYGKVAGTGNAGLFSITNSSNVSSALYATHAGQGNAAYFTNTNSNNSASAIFAATQGTGAAAIFQLNNPNSTNDAVIISNTGSGNSLRVSGVTSVDILEIQGGSDLSEGFDVRGADVQPGMVVVIDEHHPGGLVLCERAYDRRVAGIISGAGGVNTGMLMGQAGTLADGEYPVALTGRVYCLVEAGKSGIEPGDLLTTSATPGHAMKVSDHQRAPGAVIGKAMTRLEAGKSGLVLVLVNLQ